MNAIDRGGLQGMSKKKQPEAQLSKLQTLVSTVAGIFQWKIRSSSFL